MNPISCATTPSFNRITNSRTTNYANKLGTSNNIFASDAPGKKGGFMRESPAKKV